MKYICLKYKNFTCVEIQRTFSEEQCFHTTDTMYQAVNPGKQKFINVNKAVWHKIKYKLLNAFCWQEQKTGKQRQDFRNTVDLTL